MRSFFQPFPAPALPEWFYDGLHDGFVCLGLTTIPLVKTHPGDPTVPTASRAGYLRQLFPSPPKPPPPGSYLFLFSNEARET